MAESNTKLSWIKLRGLEERLAIVSTKAPLTYYFHVVLTNKSGLDSLKSTALPDSVTTVGIDWLPECNVARKLVPKTEFEVRHCPVQTELLPSFEEKRDCEPANSKAAVQLQRRNIIRFNVSGTSKFPAAKEAVGLTQKEVSVRRTLAYGTKYGIGIFCMFNSGEEQIGWVPEKHGEFQKLEKLCDKTNFRAVITTTNCTLLGDKFSKVTISITCDF
ncbi:hypothetical protein ACROYT_G015277 [Oculina patagonica]